jgi:hypothetical protein
MPDPVINHDDIERLSRTMDSLGSQLSRRDRAVLAAVIGLASAAVGAAAAEPPATPSPALAAAGASTVAPAPNEQDEPMSDGLAGRVSIQDEFQHAFTPGVLDAMPVYSVKLEP